MDLKHRIRSKDMAHQAARQVVVRVLAPWEPRHLRGKARAARRAGGGQGAQDFARSVARPASARQTPSVRSARAARPSGPRRQSADGLERPDARSLCRSRARARPPRLPADGAAQRRLPSRQFVHAHAQSYGRGGQRGRTAAHLERWSRQAQRLSGRLRRPDRRSHRFVRSHL